MSDRQRRSSKWRGNQPPDNNDRNSNNILSYKRGECPRVIDADMSLRQQKQQSMCNGGLQPSYTDFGPDRYELYQEYCFADSAKTGIIGQWKIRD